MTCQEFGSSPMPGACHDWERGAMIDLPICLNLSELLVFYCASMSCSMARQAVWHDICCCQSLSLKSKPAHYKLRPPRKPGTGTEEKVTMLKYHFCTHCGMFTAKEKEKCLYCGVDLRGMNRHFYSGYALPSLRTLLRGGPMQKLKRKTEGDTFA